MELNLKLIEWLSDSLKEKKILKLLKIKIKTKAWECNYVKYLENFVALMVLLDLNLN